MRTFLLGFWSILLMSFMGCGAPAPPATDWSAASWEEIEAAAKGQTVHLMMWQGDPMINRYVKQYVKPALKEKYDINLQISSGQGNTLVSQLMTELESGKTQSEVDFMWINGETFYQLRQIDGLYGPFVEQLPNNTYIDWANPFIRYDFQQEVAGFECPWGNVQMTWIYDSVNVQAPPKDLRQLMTWLEMHPGKFTWSNDFTGMTLLKSWLIHFAGGHSSLNGPFDEAKYEKYSTELWAYVDSIRPYLWNKGQSFPASLAQVHQLFGQGELWFTMSNNDAEVDNKIGEGVFPTSARAYVPDIGSIQNTHYLGISKHAPAVPAALVAINFMISPEAQYEKMQPSVWGDGSILATDKLPEVWQARFAQIPGRRYAPPRKQLNQRALQEPAPEYMIRLYDDFRTRILE